jgi:c-di-GMP-binding flagellar brake protein YcgR
VQVLLPDSFDQTKVFEADTIRTKWSYDGTSSVGLRFKNLTPTDEKELLKMLFTRPDSWKSKVLAGHGLWSSFQHMAMVPLRRRFLQGTRPRRAWPRIYTQVVCRLEKNGIDYRAVTKDISAVGVGLFLPLHCHPVGECRLTITLEEGREYSIKVKPARKISETHDVKLYGFSFIEPSHMDMSVFSKGKWKPPVRSLAGVFRK